MGCPPPQVKCTFQTGLVLVVVVVVVYSATLSASLLPHSLQLQLSNPRQYIDQAGINVTTYAILPPDVDWSCHADAAMVEPRPQLELISAVTTNFAAELGARFCIHVFHGDLNAAETHEALRHANATVGGRVGLYAHHMRGVQGLVPQQYSDVAKSLWFWDLMEGDKVLIFQTDAWMCPGALKRLEQFWDTDYVGCYTNRRWWTKSLGRWARDVTVQAFNGGLSFRSRHAMLDAIRSFPPEHALRAEFPGKRLGQAEEDMFFTEALVRLGYRVTTDERAKSFCAHTDFERPVVGAHKFFAYMSKRDASRVLDFCSGAEAIVPPQSSVPWFLRWMWE